MEPLGAILPGILREQQNAQRPLAMIQDAWPKVVGDRAATHSKPVSLRKEFEVSRRGKKKEEEKKRF